MRNMADSFWRAVAYCFHPKVIFLSLVPLILMMVIVMGLGALYWDAALQSVRVWMEGSSTLNWAWIWLERVGLMSLKSVVPPLLLIVAVTPLVVVMSLLAVSFMMTPALVDLVVQRRFSHLALKRGGTTLTSLVWTIGSTLAAMLAMVITLPLWLVPPLMFVVPPLIWGWLSYRVMVFDALLAHASREERIAIGKQHRLWLLLIGVLTGYLGALPSVVWASGALFAAAFLVLVPLAIWTYALVFAFTSLWFAHYSLGALGSLRAESAFVVVGATVPVPALASDDANASSNASTP